MKLATEQNNIAQQAIETTGNGSEHGENITGQKLVKATSKKVKINGDIHIGLKNGKDIAGTVKKKETKTKKASTKAAKSAKTSTAKKTEIPKKEKPKKTTDKLAEEIKPVVEKKAATAKKPATKKKADTKTQITFKLRFHTKFGQTLYITGDHAIFGSNDLSKALPMQYLNEEFWTAAVELDKGAIADEGIVYNYFIKYEDGYLSFDWGADKVLYPGLLKTAEVLIDDAWNFAGYYENAFYTEPFKHVLLRHNFTPVARTAPKTVTHHFKVKAPLLEKGQTLCISGSTKELGGWDASKAVLLSRGEEEDFFNVKLNLTDAIFPVVYKYAVYDVNAKTIVRFEGGNNRVLYDSVSKNRQTIINDGFAVLPNDTWKGAGVAIPVFSLRSENSCGLGEFADIKPFIDWAKKAGFRLIQILPINDTTATHTWTDSYPYAAISAFALHPMYLHLESMVKPGNKHLLQAVAEEKVRLNKLDTVDYEAVNKLKWSIIKQVYPLQKISLFASDDYQQFFKQNEHWLVPYAAFCYLRDKHNSADFIHWPSHKTYNSRSWYWVWPSRVLKDEVPSIAKRK